MKGKSIEEISLGLQQETYAVCAECLIEGSLKDRISHFILRLLCSAYPDMQTFFIQSETELFIYRLEFYNLSDIKKILLDTLKKSLKICKQPFITKAYKNILKTLIIVSEDINGDFEKEHIKVPFTAALDFVEKRLYPINYGYIEVPFHSIKQLCAVIFKETLIQGLNQMIVSNCTQLKDPRVDYMLQDIKQWFKARLKIPIMLISNTFILEKNLDNESENFPLCMLSLHHLLRRNHRLPHASRVQYILYLKEIGVPCDETSGNSSGGGCPYAYFDGKNIGNALGSSSFEIADIEDLKALSSAENYMEACHHHMLMKVKKITSKSNKYKDVNMKVFIQNHGINCIEEKSNCKENYNKSLLMTKVHSNDSANFNLKFSKPSDFFFILKNLNSNDISREQCL
ncbi:DNA primase large subunit [Caerostris darwini]|uniref:DNA primase large subunit n=1 Tax=Caerostris darwini TaxID=1538125 RepID=A0AAV4PPU5_9ARAC|nr:DNA primase large subunit [Caerostris darwini]